MSEISEMSFGNHASATVERNRKLGNKFEPGGVFTLEHYRDDKLLQTIKVKNGVTDVGINNILNIMFDALAQITTWYLSFIDESGFTAVAAADTMASHAGWTEFTAYSSGTRPVWDPDASSSKVSVNSVTVDFTITGGAATLKGVFLASDNTKSGTSGVLWATAIFSTDIPVTGGDLIKMTYSVTGA